MNIVSHSLRVLVVDDHELFRFGLNSVLDQLDFVSEIKEAENGRMAVEMARKDFFDVVLMDIYMPVMNGIDATRVIRKEFPSTKVLALSMYDDQQHVLDMIDHGACGYLIKNTDKEEIKNSLLAVMRGEMFFSKQLSDNVMKIMVFRHKSKKLKNCNILSNREKEIIELICKQHSSLEIADLLNISFKTVEWHRLNLLHKTNSKNTAGLVLFAINNGIISHTTNV